MLSDPRADKEAREVDCEQNVALTRVCRYKLLCNTSEQAGALLLVAAACHLLSRQVRSAAFRTPGSLKPSFLLFDSSIPCCRDWFLQLFDSLVSF